jgi:hypothetical protein
VCLESIRYAPEVTHFTEVSAYWRVGEARLHLFARAATASRRSQTISASTTSARATSSAPRFSAYAKSTEGKQSKPGRAK